MNVSVFVDKGVFETVDDFEAVLRKVLGFEFTCEMVDSQGAGGLEPIDGAIKDQSHIILLVSQNELSLKKYKKSIFACPPQDVQSLHDDALGSGFLSFRDLCRHQAEVKELDENTIFEPVRSSDASGIESASAASTNASLSSSSTTSPSFFANFPKNSGAVLAKKLSPPLSDSVTSAKRRCYIMWKQALISRNNFFALCKASELIAHGFAIAVFFNRLQGILHAVNRSALQIGRDNHELVTHFLQIARGN